MLTRPSSARADPAAPRRFLLTEKLLLRRTLPLAQLALLLHHLLPEAYPGCLAACATALARAWADPSAAQSLPLPQQGYMTTALQLCLAALPPGATEGGGGELLGLLMQGVSTRLSSPLPATRLQVGARSSWGPAAGRARRQAAGLQVARVCARLAAPGAAPRDPPQGAAARPNARAAPPCPALPGAQAMRVGRAFSLALDPAKPLFGDMGDLLLAADEAWPGADDFATQAPAPAAAATAAAGAGGVGGGGGGGAGRQALDPDELVTSWGGAGAWGGDSGGWGSGRRLCARCRALVSASAAAAAPCSAARTHARAPAVQPNPQPACPPAPASCCRRRSDSDDDPLQAYDLAEDLEAEAWEAGDKPLQLRALAAAIRKQGAPRAGCRWLRGLQPPGRYAPLCSTLPAGRRRLPAPAAPAGRLATRTPPAPPPPACLQPPPAPPADDVSGVLDALGKAEVLLRAAPEELAHAAPELLRALLFCRVPEWAEAEPGTRPEERPEARRLRSVCALLAAQPAAAGDAALAEVYSPHLDQYQRLLLLDGMCLAAQELASPLAAPRLELGGGAPRVVAPGTGRALAAAAAAAAGAAPGGGAAEAAGRGGRGKLVAPGMREASSRVWGKASIARQGAAGPQAFVSR